MEKFHWIGKTKPSCNINLNLRKNSSPALNSCNYPYAIQCGQYFYSEVQYLKKTTKTKSCSATFIGHNNYFV
jgi:hypothetical protein